MQNKLLPCPFCGGEAKIVKYCGTKIISYVECTNCLAYMGNQRIMTSSHRGKEYFESEEKLINAWNARKPMERIVEQLEEQRNTTICKMNNEPYGNQVQMWYRTGVRDAIDIVKGGVDNAG